MDNTELQNMGHMSVLMKELSDIKTSLAINTNETGNIKSSISEIKGDIKEIKTDHVTRREFADVINSVKKENVDSNILLKSQLDDQIKLVENKIDPLKKFVYGIISLLSIAVVGALLNLIL